MNGTIDLKPVFTCLLLLAALPTLARELPVGFLSVADDPRYAPQALEKGYP